jgi:dipeptidyl aminopeptidase/acylaminoacyl peptidase
LGIVSAEGGTTTWADLSAYPAEDMLVMNFGWDGSGARAWCYVTNRIQSWLDVLMIDPTTGATTKLLRDQTGAWVDEPGPLKFLPDGSFLFFSARTGFKHLYRVSADGKTITPVTAGTWEVAELAAVDAENGRVLLTGTVRGVTEKHPMAVSLEGGESRLLSEEPGTHAIDASPNGRLAVHRFSSLMSPGATRVIDATGAVKRTIEEPRATVQDAFLMAEPELVQIPTRDGKTMPGLLIRPPVMPEGKKHPVWMKTYAGPHMPQVANEYRGYRMADQLLAAEGFVVLYVDPRPATLGGAAASWAAYKQLGVNELKDLEDAADWIGGQSYVDRERIGLSGHSYGGYITAYALTHSTKFAAGISGAPVTDWRNYDTIYTERYMDTPEANPAGYEASSVVAAAKNLHGRLLLIHGAMDDNVHVQNSLQLAHALQEARKEFEIMIYPTARHGIFGQHYAELMHDFMVRQLKPEAASAPPTAAGG